jgi:2'-5' RNA ligase
MSEAPSGPRRLFVALTPPPDAVAELALAVAPVRDRHPDLRWTAHQGWHLTLAFLGDVDPDTEAELRPLLAAVAARHPAPVVTLAGSGRFGDRAVWIGIDAAPRPLQRLAADVRKAVRRAGLEVERRAWHGHLTLARSAGHPGRRDRRGRNERYGRQGPLAAVADELAEFRGRTWTATHLHLVHSTLGHGPARYRDVGTWPLDGPAPERDHDRVTLGG